MKRILPLMIALLLPFSVVAASGCRSPKQEKDADATTMQQQSRFNRPENIFTLDPGKAAFVVIDMQNFSCAPDSGAPLPHIEEVITKINRLADFCREKGVPVIWVRQNFTSDGSSNDAGLYPLFHSKAGVEAVMDLGPGTEIYPGMHFVPSTDPVVFKNRYSAFLSEPPELQEKLQSLGRTQLLIAGVAANVCVESTARDAMQLGYEVVLVSDAVTAPDDNLLEATKENVRLFFGDVRDTEDIIDNIGADVD